MTLPLPIVAPPPRAVWSDTVKTCADWKPEGWSNMLREFDDASIYQTWAHELVHWGERHMNHHIVKKNDTVAAIAQVRVFRVPGVNAGIAYVLRGPLWQKRGEKRDPDVFRHAIRGLKQHYVTQQGLLLRIAPNVVEDEGGPLADILLAEGFVQGENTNSLRTVMLDLSPSMDDLYRNLRYGWRRGFRKTLKYAFSFETGTTEELFDTLVGIYREMHGRKRFIRYVDIEKFRRMQSLLPQPLKMHITICSLEGKPVAGGVCDLSGNRALLVFLASTRRALETHAAYAFIWHQMQWLKERGIHGFDLGGVDPRTNPGGYQFKSGSGGRDARFMSCFEACANPASYHLVHCVQMLRMNYRRCREVIHSTVRRKVAEGNRLRVLHNEPRFKCP